MVEPQKKTMGTNLIVVLSENVIGLLTTVFGKWIQTGIEFIYRTQFRSL